MHLVTLVLQSAGKPEFDRLLSIRVNAENDADALVLAKNLFKSKCPNLNLAKVWCWFVEGRSNRS